MIIPTLASRRLFGRVAELQLLHDARRSLSTGRGAVVLIGGEAGIGKTRLLSEFSATLRGGRAPHYALGESLEDAPRPFGPFRPILEALARLGGPLPADAHPLVRRTLAALIGDASEHSDYLTNSVMLEKAELFAGVLRFLESVAARRATIVALEDVHWADSATLELLCHLVPRIAGTRLMIVVTYREDEVHNRHALFGPLARLAREAIVRRVVLEPLNEHDTRALIADALGKAHALDGERVREVVTRGEGNPFFTEEILKQVVGHQTEPVAASLPFSIRAMMLDRVQALEPDERSALDYAAVLGPQFDVDMLATVMGRERRHVLRALHRLRGLNLIVEDARERVHFRFRHALTRQTIYDELLSVDTRSLHAQIVASLEQAGEEAAHVDALAYHAWKAQLPDATRRYSERAGDAALELRAASQAATYFERALDLALDEDARTRLLGKLGEAFLQQADFARATAAFVAQHELLLVAERYDEAALALTRAAAEFANNGEVRRALTMLEAFRVEHGATLAKAAADHFNASLGRIATAADDFERARAALADVSQPDELNAFTHQVYWLARLFCSEHDVDVDGWRQSVAALRERNPQTYPLMRSQLLHSIASTALTFAENAEAERAIDEAIAIDRELGFARALAFASAVKACVLGVQGRLSEARACIVAALAEPEMFVVRLELALGVSPVALALGDVELATRCLDESVAERLREAGMEAAASAMLGMQAALLFTTGRSREARGMLDAAVDGEQHQFAAVYVWPLAARYAGTKRLVRLRALCAEQETNPGNRVVAACATLLDAAIAAREGDERTHELAEDAAERYRALGWPMHEAHALELAGRTDAAAAIFRRAGSIGDLRRIETQSPAPATRRAGRDRLSPREREVARLVAQGLTNRSIAQGLSVTEKTVEKYVGSIYAKLGFSTRSQLAAHFAREANGGTEEPRERSKSS